MRGYQSTPLVEMLAEVGPNKHKERRAPRGSDSAFPFTLSVAVGTTQLIRSRCLWCNASVSWLMGRHEQLTQEANATRRARHFQPSFGETKSVLPKLRRISLAR